MSEVDWGKAPSWAIGHGRYNYRNYWVGVEMAASVTAPCKVKSFDNEFNISLFSNYKINPLNKEWPTDKRINAIAQNGNTGEHYAQAKHDSEKTRYDLLPPVAIDLMAQVMTFGAKKCRPEGWRTVPDALQRYQAALLRHSFAMLRGEVLDDESGLPHSAHAMCCAAFIAELQQCAPTK